MPPSRSRSPSRRYRRRRPRLSSPIIVPTGRDQSQDGGGRDCYNHVVAVGSGSTTLGTVTTGTECTDPDPTFPPGFGPTAAFTSRGVQNNVEPADTHPSSVQVSQTVAKDVEIPETSLAHCPSATPCSTPGSYTCRKSLRNRAPVDYSLFEYTSDDDFDVEVAEKEATSVRCRQQLPIGVLRGCPECADCQKVVARWNPSGARRPVLDEAPVFYPSEEEFKDTLKYIETIRPTAESYGICRIVPPPSWKPPCLLKEKNIWEGSKFSTRVQKVDKLQNRKPSKMSSKGRMMKKRRKLSEPEENCNINQNQTGMQQDQERFGFEPGPEFTLQTFKKYADDFSNQYFRQDACEVSQPSVEDIEGEYWRIVERPTEEIEVIYGADLEMGTFGSGFPQSSSKVKSDAELKYTQSGWNLNNLPRLQGSVLSFETGDISGVSVPWVYVGMCFSSFCWHVEDHHLYSVNYMHWGAPKMWYGVPGKDAVNLEAAMRKHLPDLFEEQPNLLHNLVTQFSPALLKSEGVPVYRCVQHEGEFVLTFPRAYHAGFNCGFNCAEAVNVAPVDWLPIGQDAVELYREQCRKTTISHDKLLLGAAREAVRAQWDLLFLNRGTADSLRWKSICGPDSTIYKSLKARIEMELKQRQNLCSPSQSRKMDAEFDSTDRECAFCYYDLHLSASGCSCCPEKYTCVAHAKQLCSCDFDKRFFLFRYEVNELNVLADALGGNLKAIYRWGVSDLGLSLSSHVERGSVQDSTTVCRSTDGLRRSYMSQASTVSLVTSFACNEQKNNGNDMVRSAGPANNTICSSAEQMKTATSPSKERCKNNEVSCSRNNGISQFQTNPFSTSGGSMKTAHGLALGEHHNSQAYMSSFQQFAKTVSRVQSASQEASASVFANKLMSSHCNATPLCKDQVLISPERDNRQASMSSIQQFAKNVSRVQSALKPLVDPSLVKNTNGGFSSGGGHIGHPRLVNQQQNDGRFQSISEYPSGVEDRARGHSAVLVHPTLENHNKNGGAQKSPSIANVVHQFKCSVEPLEIGYVLPGNSWCSSQAIFPKGFRSRVKYFSVVDPVQMAYYVSEIFDAGPHGPLFMVTLENCPSKVFINVSPIKCWNMVRERLNMEIRRQLVMGRANLPSLQLPGSVDGLEMFGLSSPAIVQAIEARDLYHICTEYWRAKPHDVAGDRGSWRMPPQLPPHIALRSLFERANGDELKALRGLLGFSSDLDGITRHQAAQILDDEIAKRWWLRA